MSININSIFEQKLNEMKKTMPQIPDIKTKFSEYLNKATGSNISENTEVSQSKDLDKDESTLDILKYLAQSNSLLNTNTLLGDSSSQSSLGTNSNLTTLLALQEYKNLNKNSAE